MLMRWFVVQVPISSNSTCVIAGNCKTEELAKKVVDALEEQCDDIFRVVGPVTQNMIEGKLNLEDIDLAEAHMEHVELKNSGGRVH